MGEANFYYFNCLKLFQESFHRCFPLKNININSKNGSTTLSPPSDVLFDFEQQTPHLQNARRKARLSVPKESRQDPTMRRHRRQAPGYQARATNSLEKHAQKAQASVQSLWWQPLRRSREKRIIRAFLIEEQKIVVRVLKAQQAAEKAAAAPAAGAKKKKKKAAQ